MLILRLMLNILLLMVTPCQILLYVIFLLALWFISTLHMNIAYDVYIVNQFIIFPTIVHWAIVLHM